MKRILLSAAALLALGVGLAVAVAPSRAETVPSAPRWSSDVLEWARSLPVQEGGRIMPLETYAGFTLLGLNHKRSCDDLSGRSIGADSDVLDAVGFSHDAKKRRDRYSFDDLAPARAKIWEKAGEYSKVDAKKRSSVEEGVIALFHALSQFEGLVHFLDFARDTVPVPDAPKVRAIWDGRKDVSILDVISKARTLQKFLPAQDPHAGVKGAPPPSGDADAVAANQLLAAATQAAQGAMTLALIPPAGPREEHREWVTPGDVLFGGTPDTIGKAQEDMVEQLAAMAESAGDPRAFAEDLRTFHDEVVERARDRGEYEKVPLEVTLHKIDPFDRATWLYLIAFIVLAFSWFQNTKWIRWAALVPLAGGFVLHLTGIVLRCLIRGRPPISTLYDTFVVIAAGGVLTFVVAEFLTRRGVALAFAPVIGSLILFAANRYEVLTAQDTMPQLEAVLNTNFWLWIHVTCINFGYMGGLLAALVAHVTVFGRVFGLGKSRPDFYRLVTKITYGTLCFGLFFAVVGTILGGIWANESWGRFWGWDPKENGALMICLSQIAILHARLGGLIKSFGLAVAAIGSGCVIMFSWLGVNLLGIGLHSYGFTSGILSALLWFLGVETLTMLSGFLAWSTGRVPRA